MTEPYYRDDRVTLYLGDCREVTEWLEAHVLVTDPPYGTEPPSGYRSGMSSPNRAKAPSLGRSKTITGDTDTTVRDAVLEAWGPRPAVVFGSLLRPPPPGAVHALVYLKPPDAGVTAARAGWRRDLEGVYLCNPGWPMGAPRWSSVLRTGARNVGNPGGISARYGGHPHAKPVDVLEQLIGACPAGVIADPFAGSGSTLVAARNLGRQAIGVEISEQWCEVIARRLSQDVLDLEGAS